MSLYYKLANGDWVTEHAIETAFLITQGKSRKENKREFLDWLESHLNKTIAQVSDSMNHDIFDYAIAKENKLMAMTLYRDQHNCTLSEAKDVVEWLLGGDEHECKHPQAQGKNP